MVRLLALASAAWSVAAAPLLFRNTGAQVHYAGSKACMPCHQAIYKKFVETAMGRSVTRPSLDLLAAPVRIHNATFDRDYEVFEDNGALYQRESQQRGGQTVFETKHKLVFAIGSGENGISYAVQRGNHLFQAPLSYYSAAKRWGLSPGYEDTGEGFNRPIYEECIVCHAGRPQAVPRRDGLYRDPPFAELAVGCENCHGPGELHIAERSRRRGPLPDLSIVNPRRLAARLAEDICMQCHQGGDARVLLPGKSYADFRPGTALVRTVAIFGLPQQGKDADLLEHHASMKLSACYRGSSGKLGCLTCHDPHEQPSAARAPGYFRAKCLTCHNEQSCKLDLASRRSTTPADDCIGCHMPKRSVARISHSALTNHRIPLRPAAGTPVPANTPTPGLGGLELLNAGAVPVKLPLVTRLAAYGELMTRAPALEAKYFALLEEAARSAPDDPVVLAALGHKALADGGRDASELLAKAEQKGAPGAITYLDLSEALTKAGKQEESVAALERGEREFPYSPAIRKHLVLAYIQQKSYSKAKIALERYVQDFPEDDFMRGLLRQVRQ